MLERIDFSDIYKFLSSIGLVLMIAAIFLPMFLFQLDIVKNYQNTDSKIISNTVKQSIQYQEKLICWLLTWWWVISGLCFIIGLIFFTHGIKKWSKRQAVLDKMQDLDLQEKEKIIIPASQEEVNKKLNEDVDEIEDDNSKKPSILQSYNLIENKVFNSIRTNDPNIKINHNARVNTFIYDLIIIKRVSYQEKLHKVCEIKYYQKEIFYSYVQHGISSFLLAVGNYEKYVAADDRRINVKYYMIWICTSQDQKKRLELYIDKALTYSNEKGVRLTIILKLDSELDSIKDELL